MRPNQTLDLAPMSMPLVEHARLVLGELARIRDQDAHIEPISSTQMLDRLGQSRRAGKNLGNVVALLDAACVEADLPWIGRLIHFSAPKNDFIGKWEFWAPFKSYVVEEAPRLRSWTDADLRRIDEFLDRLPSRPEDWWNACADREALLRRVLLVVLKQACRREH